MEGVVLAFVPYGEADAQVIVYTRQYGRIDARARSIRRAGAKLLGEVRPYQYVRALLVHTTLGYRITDARALENLIWSPRAHFFGRKLITFFLSLVRGPEEDPILWDWVLAHVGAARGLPASATELTSAKTSLLARLGYADGEHALTEAEIERIIRENHLWEDAHSRSAVGVF